MTPTPSADVQAAAVEMIRRICPPHLDREAYGRLLAGHFDAHLAAVLREAADYADTLRRFDRASGTRKAAQVSENVGILRVADALRHMADKVQQAAPAVADTQPEAGPMSDRHTIDTITPNALDALYARVAKAEQEADAAVTAAAQLTILVGRRSEKAENAATGQRKRAEIFKTELRVLRSGLRANGADPTQIQNLWAQIRLRNRQWREAKQRAEQAEAVLASVRTLATRWAFLRAYGGAAYELRKALDEKPAETTPLVHQNTKPQASHSARADEPALDEQQPTNN
ncbi:hypothetical protein [Streptomyces sp. NPDC059278]|uniref:hypothetical protein n=1 Tax=Streptomyces sp. NPDC059278 TaxID=3346801 RepID=UPI0036990467